jgi:hypothetical protein
MRLMLVDTWKRKGINVLWDATALAGISAPGEVWSIRQFFMHVGNWPDEMPSNGGNTLVVAGLEGCLDLLEPGAAEAWLEEEMKKALLEFQEFAQGEFGLVLWVPSGRDRIKMAMANGQYAWHCAPPNSQRTLDFSRLFYGGAADQISRIVDQNQTGRGPDGPGWIGLHHPRLS